MLKIDREKLQVLPEGKVLKFQDYSGLIEVHKAVEHAYKENDTIIKYATTICEALVQDTNAKVEGLINDANIRAKEIVDQANSQIEQLINDANAKSAKIISDAESKRDEIFEEAKNYYASQKQKGYDDGFATGKKEVTEMLTNLTVKHADYINSLKGEIVSLVEKAVQKVVGELDKHELITGIVHNALKMIKSEKQATLKISPQDSQAVREKLDEILQGRMVDDLEIVPDSRLKPGTCVLETVMGVIDASLDVQLDAIMTSIKKLESQEK